MISLFSIYGSVKANVNDFFFFFFLSFYEAFDILLKLFTPFSSFCYFFFFFFSLYIFFQRFTFKEQDCSAHLHMNEHQNVQYQHLLRHLLVWIIKGPPLRDARAVVATIFFLLFLRCGRPSTTFISRFMNHRVIQQMLHRFLEHLEFPFG